MPEHWNSSFGLIFSHFLALGLPFVLFLRENLSPAALSAVTYCDCYWTIICVAGGRHSLIWLSQLLKYTVDLFLRGETFASVPVPPLMIEISFFILFLSIYSPGFSICVLGVFSPVEYGFVCLSELRCYSVTQPQLGWDFTVALWNALPGKKP